MTKLDGTGGDVPVLATRPTTSAGRELQVVVPEDYLGGRRFWQDRHRDGAGVNPATLLVGRHTLPPVASSLVLEGLDGSLAGNPKDTEAGPLLYDL